MTDATNAFYKAAVTNLNGKIWNLGSGKPKSINYLIKLLNKEKGVTYTLKDLGTGSMPILTK